MTAQTMTMTDGTLYTPVIFVGGKCYPMLMESEQPKRKPLSDSQKARRNAKARERRALGWVERHGWAGNWQRR